MFLIGYEGCGYIALLIAQVGITPSAKGLVSEISLWGQVGAVRGAFSDQQRFCQSDGLRGHTRRDPIAKGLTTASIMGI